MLIETVVGGGLTTEGANRILIPMLADQDNSVRQLAVKAYFFVPFTEESAALVQRISGSDPDEFIRQVATIVIGSHRVNKLKMADEPP